MLNIVTQWPSVRNENIPPHKNMDMDIHSSSIQKATRTYNGLVSKIYRQLMMLNGIKTNSPLKKMGKIPDKPFLQRGHTDGQKAHQRSSTSLVIGEIQTKTTIRYQLTPSKWLPSEKFTNNKHWRGCGQVGTLLHYWWGCELLKPLCRIP